jgi:hypothetical protein
MVTKSEFQTGQKTRDGEDQTGTYYETAVQDAVAGTLTDAERAKTAAIQDENALDPYEFNNAKD